MKRNPILPALLLAAAPVWAQTASTSYTNSTVTAIPDGSAVGVTEQINVSGLIGSIARVQVNLNLTGGFNGDLYVYLVNPQEQMAVLLNRVGVNGSNPVGYGDAGFNITLDDSGGYNNVHYYQNYSPVMAGGVLTGIWASDGENVDPQGSSVGGSSLGTSTLAGLDGTDPNGNWILFISDLSSGGVSMLNNWSLTIDTAAVPEPGAWTMGIVGALILMSINRRRNIFD